MEAKEKICKMLIITVLSLFVLSFLVRIIFKNDVLPLKGDVRKADKIDLTLETWFEESYQSKLETFLNENFGFRNFYVRLYNQLYYSFFSKAKANGVIIGKYNYLYESGYIEAYFGRDFIGKETIDNKVNKLKFIHDTLLTLNKKLIIAFAAGKASFYPEYIPDNLVTEKKLTNYKYYTEKVAEKELYNIDFNAWFLQMKDTSKHCLYPKTGIHWSSYGMYLVADSLIKYIEHIINKDLPEMNVSKIETSEKMRDTDADIEEGMNLLFNISNHEMSYPSITYTTKDKYKPKVLVIADSYYWGLYNAGLSSRVFDNGQFWFYNKAVYPESFTKKTFTTDLNLKQQIANYEVIILLSTEATLKQFAWGFIDEAYKLFTSLDNISYKKQILNIEKNIKNDKNWMKHIEEKAKQKGISLDSMVKLDAIYIYEKNNNK